jgi:hypothetical protein
MLVGVNTHNVRRAAGFHFQAVEASVATNVQKRSFREGPLERHAKPAPFNRFKRLPD